MHTSLEQRGVTQCWFAYSAVYNPENFQIPCKWLPTYLSSWVEENPVAVPAHIDGPVLISAEELSGTYWGPGALNPYQQFVGMEPTRVIEGEILEFDGSFDIPKIAAFSEWVVAEDLLQAGKPAEALPHAQNAVALDPNAVVAHEVLTAAYAANHQDDDAEQEYRTWLSIYSAIAPAFAKLRDKPRDPAQR